MNWINYSINETTTLSISTEVLDKLYKYKQVNVNDKEAGGVLLGRITEDLSKYEIIDISEPCSKDTRKRFSFIRNKNKAQQIINKAFKESDGIVRYMGEWHTHPELYPTPSSVDIKLINDCSTFKYAPNMIFLIILGYQGDLYIGCKEVEKRLINIDLNLNNETGM